MWQLREGLHRLRLAEEKPGRGAMVPLADAKEEKDLSLAQSFNIPLILICGSAWAQHVGQVSATSF